jgi:hypothetical protein
MHGLLIQEIHNFDLLEENIINLWGIYFESQNIF